MNFFKSASTITPAPPPAVLPSGGELTEILDSCEKVPESGFSDNDAMEKLAKLESMGFKTASENLVAELAKREKISRASGYLKITRKNIADFLKKKLPQQSSVPTTGREVLGMSYYVPPNLSQRHPDLGEHKAYRFPTSISPFSSMGQVGVGSYFEPKPGVLFLYESRDNKAYAWLEIPIELYKTSPPLHILDRLAEEKNRNIFDRYVVASVEEYDLPKIVDPLLLGVIEGVGDRFFVAQWDKDISIDDLI